MQIISGFIIAEIVRLDMGHIITIDVHAESRRCGLGVRLMNSVEERFRESGCREIVLETAVDNRAALSFYKRQGYFLVKTIPRYYTTGVDAFVLKKELPLPVRAS
jgi:ribosomal protein S18 acetylase RimI-like enzyme